MEIDLQMLMDHHKNPFQLTISTKSVCIFYVKKMKIRLNSTIFDLQCDRPIHNKRGNYDTIITSNR